jgi:hypothetical protein
VLAAIVLALLCGIAPLANAAERPIPAAVNIRAFAVEQGDNLDVLVRMPLGAVKNVQFPVGGDTGALDLAQMRTMLTGIAEHWVAANFAIRQGKTVVARPQIAGTRLSIISDPSFNAYASAAARFAAPELLASEQVFWQQVWLDAHLRYTLDKTARVVSIEPRVAHLGVIVSTQLTIIDAGRERTLSFEGDPGRIFLAPRSRDTASQFFAMGIRAVVASADVAVFLFCLALPFRRLRDAWPAAGTFAVAMCLALIAIRSGWLTPDLWWRSLLDVCAAAVLLLVAAANVVNRVTPRRRASFAFVAGGIFGLLSGLRLDAFAQYAADNQFTATASFGIGLVLTSIALMMLSIPVLRLLFAYTRAETLERIIVAALAADTAWSWLLERGGVLRRIPMSTPLQEGLPSTLVIGLLAAIVLAGVLWLIDRWLKYLGFVDEAPRTNSESPA